MNSRSMFIRDCLAVVLIVGATFLAASMAGVAAYGQEPFSTIDADPTGQIFRRQPSDCPDGKCPIPGVRTQPYAPESAPLFESIPPAATPPTGAPPADGVVASDPLYPTPTALTPEQKEALKGLLVQVITFLVGSMIGSGAASPFLKMILEKMLGAVGGATPAGPAATPVRTRKRRVSRAKKKTAKVS